MLIIKKKKKQQTTIYTDGLYWIDDEQDQAMYARREFASYWGSKIFSFLLSIFFERVSSKTIFIELEWAIDSSYVVNNSWIQTLSKVLVHEKKEKNTNLNRQGVNWKKTSTYVPFDEEFNKELEEMLNKRNLNMIE